jgi:hypothetical protein
MRNRASAHPSIESLEDMKVQVHTYDAEMGRTDVDRDNGSANYTRTSLIKSNFSQLYSVKLDHKFTDNVSLSGFYLYNSTNEPCSNFFGSADQSEPNTWGSGPLPRIGGTPTHARDPSRCRGECCPPR